MPQKAKIVKIELLVPIPMKHVRAELPKKDNLIKEKIIYFSTYLIELFNAGIITKEETRKLLGFNTKPKELKKEE